MKSPTSSLVTSKSNIAYLSGFTGSSGFMLLTKSQKYLFTDFRYIERAKNSIKRGIKIIDTTKMWRNPEDLKKNWQTILKKHRINNLGIEENHLTIATYKKFKKISPKVKFSDISGKTEAEREIKSKLEIENTTKSQRINEKVFREIKKFIQQYCGKKIITEMNLAWAIKQLGHQFGAEDISFEPIVAFGKNSALPHHQPGKTKLKKGDLVLIDMGMKYKGYCSDMTRIIFTATPTKLQKEIYETVLAAQKAALKTTNNGFVEQKIDSLARTPITEAGYSENFGHGTGHGIGLKIHESPSLSPNGKNKIKPGMVITVEPGIYLPGKFGIRIEDMAIVTKTGLKNITHLNKDIDFRYNPPRI